MKITDILEQCFNDVKSGLCTIEECLSSHPESKSELELLLKTALMIEMPCDVKPSQSFKTRTRVFLMEEIHSSMKSGRSRFTIFRHLPRMAGAVIAVALALLAAGSGTVYAAQGSLPGDALYGVKLASEEARAALTFSPSNKVDIYLSSAEERVNEITELAELGRTGDINTAANNLAKTLDKVLEKAGERDELLEKISLDTSNHLLVLGGVLDLVPEQARAAVSSARDASLKGQQAALRALAKHNPVLATEINLSAMQSALDRAVSNGISQDSAGLEAALDEYASMQAFGQEISDIAKGLGQDTTTVEQLVATATSRQLEVLANVYDKVPEQARGAIENAMTNTAEEHGKASGSLEEKGVENQSPEKPSLPPSMPEEVKQKLEDAFSGKDKGPPATSIGGGNDGKNGNGKDKDKSKAP